MPFEARFYGAEPYHTHPRPATNLMENFAV